MTGEVYYKLAPLTAEKNLNWVNNAQKMQTR